MDHLDNDTYDVIVVGAGPVGLMAGRLLGLAGHRVLIVERWPELYPLPRAVHFDHEIGRLLQSAGLAEEVKGISSRVTDFYEWRNRDGEPLLKIDWSVDGSCGWPVANFFSQPDLEAVLAESVTHMPNVTLIRGREVVGATESQDDVEVTVAEFDAQLMRPKPDQSSTHKVRYVVGADGGPTASSANRWTSPRQTSASTSTG